MKITRNKKLQRAINFYSINFGFYEPYQILIDATFCLAALKNKIDIREQLEKYFQSELKLLTTKCCIMEAEKLGYKVSQALYLVKKFPIHSCGHEANPISGSECFKSMIKEGRYIVATQDRDLQISVRKKPGKPLLYLHMIAPILEQPTDESKKYAQQNSEKNITLNTFQEKRIKHLKDKEGIIENDEVKKIKKSKKIKNPNPLCCLKKKTNKKWSNRDSVPNSGVQNKLIEKKKRVRVKVPKHVKEHFKSQIPQLIE